MTLVRERAERLPAGLRIDALAVWFLFALVAVEIFLTCSYGFGNLANDFWLEQVVKRGWTSWGVPNLTVPGATIAWGLIAIAAVVVWVAWFRPDARNAD